MTTANALVPQVVSLEGGLDYVTPRTTAPPGTLVDCYNFEVADRLGYKRMDGIERFDGRASVSDVFKYSYIVDYTKDAGDPAPVAGDSYYVDGDTTQDCFFTVASITETDTTSGTMHVVVINFAKFFRVNFLILNSVPVNCLSTAGDPITIPELGIFDYANNWATVSALQTQLITEYGNYNRPSFPSTFTYDPVTGAFALNPVTGMVWYKDQLYCIRDLHSIFFENGTTQIYPNDVLVGQTSGGQAIVRDYVLTSGNWDDGDAAGQILYSLDSDYFGQYGNGNIQCAFDLAASETLDIHRGTSTVVTGAMDTATFPSDPAPTSWMASMVRSWGINQLPAGSPYTDQGWEEIDLGYKLQFENGNSMDGGFVRVGRNAAPTAEEITATAWDFPTVASGNLVDPPKAHNYEWENDPTMSFNENIETTGDSKFITTTSNGGTLGFLSLTGLDFSDLPDDALITGIEAEVAAFAPPKTTTDAGAVLPDPSASNIVVPVASTSGLTVGTHIHVSDGTNTIHGTIASVSAGVSVTMNTLSWSIDAGAIGNTLASGARVNYTELKDRKLNVELTIVGGTSKGTAAIAPLAYDETAPNTFSFGGANDLWGLDILTPEDINNADFGLNLSVSNNYLASLGSGGADVSVDYVRVRIHYQLTSSIYYFWNGTDDVKGVVTTYVLDSGAWDSGTAAGTLQIARVVPVTGAVRSTIHSGDEIWTGPGGTGSHIADVASEMEFSGLPSLADLQEANSQYEIITANFYGSSDWEALYGVSGCGRAFTYDGFYFRNIFVSGLSDLIDKPRHLAFHSFHLCLGYPTGSLQVSVTGDPEDFTGVNGATEEDFGDRINGLQPMNGTTLGVFCKKSIQALNGSDADTFSTSILVPKDGAIEYTIVDIGGKIIYASYKGISTFDQSAAYGNFVGSRLSANITPWLLPRLTSTARAAPLDLAASSGAAATSGPKFAMPDRSKNQYRLAFEDGYWLTMTLMGQEQIPVFTIQSYNFDSEADQTLPGIPLAHSSNIDSKGLDRNHVSFYNPARGQQAPGNTLDTFLQTQAYVYELNRGWGIGTTPILAWFTTTHQLYDSPFDSDTIKKIRLHGQSKGLSTLKVSVSSDYGADDFQYGEFAGESNWPPQDISIPRNGGSNASSLLTEDYRYLTNIADVAKRGRSFAIQFFSAPTTIEPPVVAQTLLIQITEGKADI